MQRINTHQDIVNLRRARVAPIAQTEHIFWFFQQLEAELTNDKEGAFHLDQNGSLILLEAGDNLRSLKVAGLSGDDLRRVVEFVERIDLGGVQAYRLAAMLYNDFVVTIFTVA